MVIPCNSVVLNVGTPVPPNQHVPDVPAADHVGAVAAEKKDPAAPAASVVAVAVPPPRNSDRLSVAEDVGHMIRLVVVLSDVTHLNRAARLVNGAAVPSAPRPPAAYVSSVPTVMAHRIFSSVGSRGRLRHRRTADPPEGQLVPDS